MEKNNTANDDKYYEYNDNRSIYQPSLFDFYTEKELNPDAIETVEADSIYEIDFEELDMDEAELFLS